MATLRRLLDACARVFTLASASWPALLCSFGLLVLITMLLLLLKVAQVEREFDADVRDHLHQTQAANDPLGVYLKYYDEHRRNSATLMLHALDRRADDPSFWFVVTLVLTTGCLSSASAMLASLPMRRPSAQSHPRPRARWTRLSLLVFAVLLAAYLIMTFLSREGFFRYRDGTKDRVILGIQTWEASAVVVAIVLGVRALSASLNLTDATRRHLRSGGLSRMSIGGPIAWRLIMCSYGALVALNSGIAICQALDIFSTAFGPFTGLRMFLLFAQLLPFFFVGAYVKARLRPWFEIRRVAVRPAQLPTIVAVLTAGSVALNSVRQWVQSGILGLFFAVLNVAFVYRAAPRTSLAFSAPLSAALGPWVERRAYSWARRILHRTGLWRR